MYHNISKKLRCESHRRIMVSGQTDGCYLQIKWKKTWTYLCKIISRLFKVKLFKNPSKCCSSLHKILHEMIDKFVLLWLTRKYAYRKLVHWKNQFERTHAWNSRNIIWTCRQVQRVDKLFIHRDYPFNGS